MNGNIWLAFGMTALAGLSTGIGGATAFFAKKTNTRFLAVCLGFSAGVMIYVSMIEIFFTAQTFLIDADGVIHYKYIGAVDERVWADQLGPRYQALLEQASGGQP